MTPAALVVGGGVAGIAAAVRLCEAGWRVTLVEARPVLGGRAASYIDRATGERVDKCKHITMRCCTNLADLLARLGTPGAVRYLPGHSLSDGTGRVYRLSGSRLPAPLHVLPSFARFGALAPRERLAVAGALARMLRTAPAPHLDDVSAAEALRRQPARALDRFWRPVLVSACNADLHDLSYLQALQVFRTGFLSHGQAFQMGLFARPLEEVYNQPAADAISARGGRVLTGERVGSLLVRNGRATGVRLTHGGVLEADCVVCAVPFDALPALLPQAERGHPTVRRLEAMRWSPIVGVHAWFDEPVRCPPAVGLLGGAMHWAFAEPGNRVSLVASAARGLVDLPRDEVAAQALRDVRHLVPGATSVRTTVIKERRATFLPRPGLESLRPDQRAPFRGLYLAGDWTRTGWPATMEGAARSGYLAAECALADAGTPRALVAPDLAASALARTLMD